MDLSPQNEGMRLPTKDEGEVSYKEKWPGYHADENEDEDEDEDDDDDDDDDDDEDEDEEEGRCRRKQWGALAER